MREAALKSCIFVGVPRVGEYPKGIAKLKLISWNVDNPLADWDEGSTRGRCEGRTKNPARVEQVC